MHILFLSDNFPPEVNAPATRSFEHCREWVKAGHQATVITCAPNFPRGEVFAGYRNRLWQSEELEGIRVIRVWSYITSNEGFTRRILDYTSFLVTATIAALFVRRVDVIVGTSPQFFTACAACAVSLTKRRPWVFELRDIWPESIRAVGAMKDSRILDFLERLELFLYRRAARVVSVTHAFRDNLIFRGIDGDKIDVITNGVDLERFTPRPKDAELAGQLGLEGRFVAGYIGTMGMAHGLDTLLDTAALLRENPAASDIRLLLLGDGAQRRHLMKRAEREGLENVLFLETVPKSEVARYWSLLDVAIIHLRASPLFETVIPSKLFECMAMGLPIIHGVMGESAKIVEDNEVGVTVAPENPEEMAAVLLRLASDHALCNRLAQNGPKAAQDYDRKILARPMLDILESLRTDGNALATNN